MGSFGLALLSVFGCAALWQRLAFEFKLADLRQAVEEREPKEQLLEAELNSRGSCAAVAELTRTGAPTQQESAWDWSSLPDSAFWGWYVSRQACERAVTAERELREKELAGRQKELTEVQAERDRLKQELAESQKALREAKANSDSLHKKVTAVEMQGARGGQWHRVGLYLVCLAVLCAVAMCAGLAVNAESGCDQRPQKLPELSAAVEADVTDVRRYAGASALDFYDAVLTVQRLGDMYAPGKGWEVRVAPRRRFDFGGPLEGVRVIPLGQFNAGKTWLIGQLSGEELPRGVAVHTEGISVKAASADGLKIVLLDTAGSNSPVGALACGGGPPESVLQERHTQEEFLRQWCFEVGQVILLVIGQMSHKDQTDLVRLSRAVRKDRVRKDIVVVHNLRDWDVNMLTERRGEDGMSYCERTQALLGLSEASLEVAMGTERELVIRHTGLFEVEGDINGAPVMVYHYYLTNHRLPCSRNKFVIQDMRATITRAAGPATSLAEELAAAATRIQSRFASFSVPEPEILFDPSTSRLRAKEALPTGAVRMRPRDLGSFFAASSDDPAYSVTLVKCSAAVAAGRGTARKVERQERWAYHLQIELPGLRDGSLASIREQLLRRGNEGALRREQLVGEHAAQWTVCLQAELENIPCGHYDQVAEATVGELELSADVADHQVADAGSRPNFRGGARTVKVTLRTGIMDYDSSHEPLASYADGVLGITLLRQGKR